MNGQSSDKSQAANEAQDAADEARLQENMERLKLLHVKVQ